MARYITQNGSGKIQSVEFSTIDGKTYAFFTLAPNQRADALQETLTSKPLNQDILSVTPSPQGALVVTRGGLGPDAMLSALAQQGELLAPPPIEKKPFNPWAWRGYTSIVGQSLQIASSMKGNGTAADRMAIFGFAALNLTANFINILFGAQKKSDPHQLRLLKQQANEQLSSFTDVENLPNPDFIVATENGKATTDRGASALLQKHSVSFGEIGLRTLGAFSLSFPITKWRSALHVLRESGSVRTAFKEMRNPNPVTFGAGLITLLGKFISLSASEPDPYNTTPPSLLDRFRQNVAFRLSSVIEGGAAVWMTHDRFTNQKISIGGKEMPDYLGGAGNAVFVGGYGVRLTAPYGSREVNMPELYAHIGLGLSKLSAEDLPQATVRMATQLHQHFNKPELPVSEIYAALVNELHTKHHRSVEPAPQIAVTKDNVPQVKTPDSRIIANEAVNAQRLVAPVGASPALA